LGGVAEITLELRGFLANRLAALGTTRGTRAIVSVPLETNATVARLLTRLVEADDRYALLFDAASQQLPEHVEVVLNDRVLDLQGGLTAVLKSGDVLTFIPAHAGGAAARSGRIGHPTLASGASGRKARASRLRVPTQLELIRHSTVEHPKPPPREPTPRTS
jgi:molybdopterin converting factor small subunit